MRKLTRQTIKPVLRHVQNSVGGANKFYHFTLDTYNGHNSFKGGVAYGLIDCYSSIDDQPFDAYALELATGKVIDLTTKQLVFMVAPVKEA